MKPNFSKNTTKSGKKIIKLLSKTDIPLIPHFLKDFISDYKDFTTHHKKYNLWTSIKNNKSNKKYDKIILLVSGIAAGGKDAFKEEIFRISPNLFTKAVTGTSRQPREGEVHTKDYYFFESREHFINSVNNNEFIEYVEQGNGFYGLPRKSLDDAIKKDDSSIIWTQIEMSAWTTLEEHVSKSDKNICVVKLFVLPHMSLNEYKLWLSEKRNDNIKSRLQRTGWEIENAASKSDFIITNIIKKDSNCLNYTAKTVINELIDFLNQQKENKFELPFDKDDTVEDILEIINIHKSIE